MWKNSFEIWKSLTNNNNLFRSLKERKGRIKIKGEVKMNLKRWVEQKVKGVLPLVSIFTKSNTSGTSFWKLLLFDHRPCQLRTGRNLIYWYTRVYSLELSQMGKKPAICSVSTHNLVCSNSSLTCMPGEKKSLFICAVRAGTLLSWAISREEHSTWHRAGI